MKVNHIVSQVRLLSSMAIIAMGIVNGCSNKSENGRESPTSKLPIEITKVVGVARIEPENGLLYIYANANGLVESTLVNENDLVRDGSSLIILDRSKDIAQLNREKSKLMIQKAVIQAAEADANAARLDLQKSGRETNLNDKLFSAKVISEQTLNESKEKFEKLQFVYNTKVAELSVAHNKLMEVEADINYQNIVVYERAIRAPFNGKVLQLDVQKGDFVITGQKLGQFAPEGHLVAVTEVDELFAELIKVGMKADVISLLDKRKIDEGEVIFVADFLKKKSLFSDENTVEDRRVKEVRVRLTSTSKVVINSRVDCIIYLQ
jgi:HlyD family secretion protein